MMLRNEEIANTRDDESSPGGAGHARDPRPPEWAAVATGDLCHQMLQAADEIVRLVSPINEPRADIPPPVGDVTGYMSGGLGGPLLLAWYHHVARSVSPSERVRRAILEELADTYEHSQLAPGLYTGVAGLGWLYWHVLPNRGPGDQVDPLADLDAVLGRWVAQWPTNDCDVIAGLCGIGVYALQCRSRWQDALLSAVIERLEAAAAWDSRGAKWIGQNGLVDLGMAHGCGGVVAFLSHAVRIMPRNAALLRLLGGAVEYLLAMSEATGKGHDIASLVRPDGLDVAPAVRTSPAWCYGGLGVSCAINNAARATGQQAWRERALTMARAQAERLVGLPESPLDAGLCHGLAGATHMLNCLSQATADEALRDAAVQGYQAMLARRVRHGADSIAGFRSQSQFGEWIPARGLLIGASGVGLALLAGATTVRPLWNELFLI
ncbi:MAG: lanthionine synthetase LanC family protein [Gemmatimonadales bacterium]